MIYGEINSAMPSRKKMALKSIASSFTNHRMKDKELEKNPTYFIESVWSSVNPQGQVFFQMLRIRVVLLKQSGTNFLKVLL